MKSPSVVLAFSLALLGAGSMPRPAAADATSLVGTWTAEQTGLRMQVVFASDGSFARTMTAGSESATVHGQYVQQGNMLLLRPQGQTFIQYTIRELEHDRLVLVGMDGAMLDLARARPTPHRAPAKPASTALPPRGSQPPDKGIPPQVSAAIPPVKQVNPVYPAAAKAAGIQGSVRLRVTINKDGSPQDVRVLSGRVELVKASLAVLPDWRWAPSKDVRVTVVTIAFTLTNGSEAPHK